MVCGLGLVNRNHTFSNVLASFAEFTSVSQRAVPFYVDVQHHILTNGPTFFERARRLSPEKLAAEKAIFIIASSTKEEYENHLRIVFQRLKKFSLRINLSKCESGKSELEFLGYNEIMKVPFQLLTRYELSLTLQGLRQSLNCADFSAW